MQAVFAALADQAAARPLAPAFREGAVTLRWGELARRVAALAAALEGAPRAVGVAVAGGIDHVVADLAVTLSGRRLVPLPPFFSPEQKAHVLEDARVGLLIADWGTETFGLPLFSALQPGGAALPGYAGGATRVIYTSGSSGRPKGVVIGDRQLSASLAGLAGAVRPAASDRHLSVLPLAQLLEQICGVFLPILAGAEVVFCPEARIALAGGPIEPLAEAMAHQRPTTSLLVPALLAKWVAWLEARDARGPDSLRLVAVGGAAAAPALVAAAGARGLPVFEGYGLSECCSVVAMNRPGDAVPGTVGRVLDGIRVTIEDGEIVVEGPSVMKGYLNGPPAPARWRTGDRGRFEDGRLVVEGRRDALLVLPTGRNVSPEWVEARVDADARVIASVLCLGPDGRLLLLVAARAPIAPGEIARLCADLPAYARPAAVALVDPRGLFFPSGAPDRAAARRIAAAVPAEPLPEPEPAVS
jgi:long-subunit acyl-CoA synthetase (AMP-forming)